MIGLSLSLLKSEIDFRSIVEAHGHLLVLPLGDVDELERVVLAEYFVIAQDVELLVEVDVRVDLERDELLEVGDGRVARAENELAAEVLEAVHGLQAEYDWLVVSMEILIVLFVGGGVGSGGGGGGRVRVDLGF